MISAVRNICKSTKYIINISSYTTRVHIVECKGGKEVWMFPLPVSVIAKKAFCLSSIYHFLRNLFSFTINIEH